MCEDNFNLGCRVSKVTGARYTRDETEKKAALKLLKKARAEEQFVGMCARCLSTGLLAKKINITTTMDVQSIAVL